MIFIFAVNATALKWRTFFFEIMVLLVMLDASFFVALMDLCSSPCDGLQQSELIFYAA